MCQEAKCGAVFNDCEKWVPRIKRFWNWKRKRTLKLGDIYPVHNSSILSRGIYIDKVSPSWFTVNLCQ